MLRYAIYVTVRAVRDSALNVQTVPCTQDRNIAVGLAVSTISTNHGVANRSVLVRTVSSTVWPVRALPGLAAKLTRHTWNRS